MTTHADRVLASFRAEYGAQRAAEGRGYAGTQLMALPYLHTGPHARQWAVRARTFDAFMRIVVAPAARRLDRAPDLLDLGAGNGWLSHRASLAGCDATAIDLRDDVVDGLGAAAAFQRADSGGGCFHRIAASFDRLPVRDAAFDIVVFNASLHYAVDLPRTLGEARRVVRSGGRVVILDSPFYDSPSAGEAMVREKHRDAPRLFGARAEALLAQPVVEYLTAERLSSASVALGARWRRHRVRYPLWYELRGVRARLRGRRPPSRFDLWECTVP